MKKGLSIVVVAALMLSILVGCTQTKVQEVEMVDITLSEVIHSVFYAPQYIALNEGFFADEGLNVTLEVAWGADKGAAALFSNSAQIALFGVEAAIYSLQKEAQNPIIAFAQLTQRDGSMLIGREKQENFDWSSLKDKVLIGGRKGGMPQMVLEWILVQNGLKPHEDVEIIQNIQLSATAAAFVEGIGDYVQLWEPGGTKLAAEGRGYAVASLGKASGLIPYTVYHATSDYMNSHPEVIQKFTNAIYRAQIWCETHTPEEIAAAIIPNHFEDFDYEVMVEVIRVYKDIEVWDINPCLEEDSLDLMQDIMISYGTLENKIEFSEIVDNSFAIKAIYLKH